MAAVKSRIKKTAREDVIERELVRRVEALGGIAEKVTVIGRRGFFDRLVVLPGGKIFFVECKRPRGGIVSGHQKRRHTSYRMLGAQVVLVANEAQLDSLLLGYESLIKQKAGSR